MVGCSTAKRCCATLSTMPSVADSMSRVRYASQSGRTMRGRSILSTRKRPAAAAGVVVKVREAVHIGAVDEFPVGVADAQAVFSRALEEGAELVVEVVDAARERERIEHLLPGDHVGMERLPRVSKRSSPQNAPVPSKHSHVARARAVSVSPLWMKPAMVVV